MLLFSISLITMMKNDGIQLALSTYATYAHHDVFFENSPLRLLVDHSLIGTFGYQKGQKDSKHRLI